MFVGLLVASSCTKPVPEFRVIGYMPAWKDLRRTVDQTDLARLTHINVAFLNPDTSAALTSAGEPVCMRGATSADLHYLVRQAHQAQVRVLASLGGGVIPRCSGNWEELLGSDRRQALVASLSRFVDEYGLDGIDVDLEGVLLTAIDQAGNYTPFIRELAAALQPAGKLLTCATASYEGGMIPVESIPFFDFVNIMSYDAIGPNWGVVGSEHSTYEQALGHIETWRGRGLTRNKLVLGVPFYGYGFGREYRRGYSYREILETFGEAAADTDLIGMAAAGASYVTYNGRATIRRKTQLAREQGSGVMIWEISQDAAPPDDLLSVIHEEAARKER